MADERAELLTPERFPAATGFTLLERPEQLHERAPIDAWTHVVVMSHAIERDRGYLSSALRTPARGISMLGPAGRTQRLMDELRAAGVALTDEDVARIHAPAGLDLGAEGPEEIAAAIVAEVVALRRGRRGGFLRERTGPIHDR